MLFMLKQSYISYYTIYMTVPLMLKTNQFYVTVASIPDVIDDGDVVLETLQSASFELKRLNKLSKFFIESTESIF